jgi:hypothetical protein
MDYRLMIIYTCTHGTTSQVVSFPSKMFADKMVLQIAKNHSAARVIKLYLDNQE